MFLSKNKEVWIIKKKMHGTLTNLCVRLRLWPYLFDVIIVIPPIMFPERKKSENCPLESWNPRQGNAAKSWKPGNDEASEIKNLISLIACTVIGHAFKWLNLTRS